MTDGSIRRTPIPLFVYGHEANTMRTDIVLDDELVERARQLTGLKTKSEVIQAALRTFIRLHEQAEIRALRGKLKWEGDLHEQRLTRTEN